MEDKGSARPRGRASTLDQAMLWLVLNHEFVSSQEKELADLYAELHEARNC